MPPRSERALRRLIAELATLPAGETQAILAALSPSERDRVSGLLERFAGDDQIGAPSLTFSYEPPAPGEGPTLAQWMRARLENPSDASQPPLAEDGFLLGQRAPHLLTPTAFAALRAAVEDVWPRRSTSLQSEREPTRVTTSAWANPFVAARRLFS